MRGKQAKPGSGSSLAVGIGFFFFFLGTEPRIKNVIKLRLFIVTITLDLSEDGFPALSPKDERAASRQSHFYEKRC